ncbi:MAG: c-type cytochrome [Gemmatimonadales bacterium]
MKPVGRHECFGGLLLLLVLSPLGQRSVALAQNGSAIFEAKCKVCHSTGSDRLVGPGLKGVTERRAESWVKSFITGPDAMIASGDSIATRLVSEYVVQMPNLGLSDADAEAVIRFLGGGEGSVDETAGQPGDIEPATETQILLGQNLFQGKARLTNGGPACNSCHEVTNDAVIGGGVLARELTSVFSRLGGPGVRAILGSPPFPVMQRAYLNRPLTENEVTALVGFLQRADQEQAFHQPRDYGTKLFAAGVLGAGLLLLLYSLLWSKRKKGSVNQAIYDRQIKTT